MRKVLKNILIISDDFYYPDLAKKGCEPGDIYYDDTKNWLRFKLDIKKTFKISKISMYDGILIDYGFIGRKEEAIELLQEAKTRNIQLAWIGGLPEHYNKDAQAMFPRLRFIHNLPVSGICNEDILFLLYGMFSGCKRKSSKPKRVLKKQSKKRKSDDVSSLKGLADLIMRK